MLELSFRNQIKMVSLPTSRFSLFSRKILENVSQNYFQCNFFPLHPKNFLYFWEMENFFALKKLCETFLELFRARIEIWGVGGKIFSN
jgi:hypothetical protein